MSTFAGIYSISGRPLSPVWLKIGKHTYYARNLSVASWLPEEKIIIGKYCSIGDQVVLITGGNRPTHRAATYPVVLLRPPVVRIGHPEAAGITPQVTATLAAISTILPLFYPASSYRTTRNTTLGNDVWVGFGAMISNGAQVGDGAVVASGSVVLSDIPPYAIAAGNPARVVRYRFSPEVVRGLLKIRWWDWPEDRIRDNLEWFYRPAEEFVRRFNPHGEQHERASGSGRKTPE